MIKFLCLTVLFVGVSYIGVSIGLNYNKRERFWCEVIMFCNMLSNNIKFNKNKVKLIINSNLENYKTEFKQYLIKFLSNEKYEIKVISRIENDKLNEFFNSVGKMDSCGEINNIENYKLIFNEFYNDSKKNNNRYGNLYSKLGVILGLILVIVLI